jgi:hypothetical protein
MLRTILMTAGLALLPAVAFAADLSGTWVRDGARSDVVPSAMYWLVRDVEAGNTRGPTSQPVVIEVKQTADTLEVTDPAEPLRVYRLDGQVRTVPADTGVTSATVRASEEGETVVVETAQSYSGLPGGAPLSVRKTWRLAEDGTLTVVTVRTTPATSLTYTEVYNRR